MDGPFLIAGPCSAESPEQVWQAAQHLASFRLPQEAGGQGIRFFRAGLWKPRSKPGSFEGVGAEGIPWLVAAQDQFGLSACTEVAQPKHVELVANAGLKGVWIGTRTTTNPFLVQELAQALQGTPMTVFVKNPINPDLPLWLGAVDRFLQAGVKHVVAIHRGFSDYHVGQLRNAPLWMVPIEFKINKPDITLLCDPSHLCGHTQFIPEITQRALDLNFDGLMLEVHPHPEQALCDARQQLDLVQFDTLMSQLKWPSAHLSAHHASEDIVLLNALRARMDVLDDDIVDLLAQRMAISEQIGAIKKRNGIGIVQFERWKQVRGHVLSQSNEKYLDAHFMETIYKSIHEQSIARQEKIIRD